MTGCGSASSPRMCCRLLTASGSAAPLSRCFMMSAVPAALVSTVATRRAAECEFFIRNARCSRTRTAMAADIYGDGAVCLRVYSSSTLDRSVACGHIKKTSHLYLASRTAHKRNNQRRSKKGPAVTLTDSQPDTCTQLALESRLSETNQTTTFR